MRLVIAKSLMILMASSALPGVALAQAAPIAARAVPGYAPAEPNVGQFSPSHQGVNLWDAQVTILGHVCDSDYSDQFQAVGVHDRDEALKQTGSQLEAFDQKMKENARRCSGRPH